MRYHMYIISFGCVGGKTVGCSRRTIAVILQHYPVLLYKIFTVAYEVKCHPAHSTILKSFLIKTSVLDLLPPSDTNIHFICHGLIKFTDATTVKDQPTQ